MDNEAYKKVKEDIKILKSDFLKKIDIIHLEN